ncbi:MAG: hypothetical protein KatS3mg118_0716 [Paracoccaceae bacterium]|nr:MAG: hypothetical protein KatS3mg118_0716 [Paracoccaceae bacterium]
MAGALLALIRRVNRAIALAVGIMLLAAAGFVLVDIVLRRLGASLGGSDEISGYAMALATSWGMGFALVELGHVRIEVLRSRAPGGLRAALDLVAMLALALVVTLVALRGWPVLARSLANGSRANTPLETPLALVQGPWLAGWAWFALTAWGTLLAAAWLLLRGERAAAEAAIGTGSEGDAPR